MPHAPRLFAISDLHIERRANWDGLVAMPPLPNDWLILGGDVAESVPGLERTLDLLSPRFAQLLWVPGNHELWTVKRLGDPTRGQARYRAMVAACRSRGVWTPEDDYAVWPGSEPGIRIAPTFTLYDYSFVPDGIEPEDAVAWAASGGIVATDESVLHPDPFPSRSAWCQARVAATEARLAAASQDHRLVIVGHFPPRYDLLTLGRVARFSPWCGTRLTERWHLRYNAVAMVYGHLHVPRTAYRDGVRFEEVSLGYPRDWSQALGVAAYLRRIL